MKMKSAQLSMLALSIAAAFGTNVAYAGQIQSSSVSIAREVITTNTQTIIAPSIAYRFAGDVDARVQAQTFQVQFILGAGSWGTLPATFGNAISVSDGVTAQIQDQSAVAPVGVNASYTVSNVGVSSVAADGSRTVWATITVNQGATALIKQPLISMNVTSNLIAGVAAVNVSASRAPVTGLFDVVGNLVTDFNATPSLCQAVKTMPVSFKHYTALSAPASQATDTTATADEHTRGGATNTATLITFPTNILPVVTASTGNAKVNVAAANLQFTGSATVGAAPDSWVSTTIANLGMIALKQNSTGYDSDLVNQYLLAGGGAGILAAATAVNNIGRVEGASFEATVTATNGFVSGGTLWLDTGANCATAIVSNAGVATPINALNAAGPIKLTIGTAQLNAAFGATGLGPVYTCYGVAGVTSPIPLSKFNVTAATLVKSAAGAGLNEQNNSCSGTHYSLGGGVKIDVRNYANSKDPSGWMSVIRLINNNESRSIDVWGQLIHADGTYGPYGLLSKGQNAGAANADKLAPRAVLNLTSAQVDALLTSAPAHATANGSATPKADVTGARLRVTSEAGSSLRVQNYLYNPASQNFIEASSSQAVDFEGTVDRAPVNEGQYQSQDAQAGLNGK
ncbi:MAG: hypothetical protein Q8N54_07260 [Sulfurimicrobium sp.]|jgi:hypothetical protein|nr:hypothetical protein [Sulfurimicrobium sp.]